MQIQAEVKREMKRYRSWEVDRDRNIKNIGLLLIYFASATQVLLPPSVQ